jgi:uncharacterized protein YjbI with pentapeptide repeats
MGVCAHLYPEPHGSCPHATVEPSEFCLWHNPQVRKDDAYLPALLEAVDTHADGGLDGFHLVGLHWPEAMLPGRSLRHADLRDAILDMADLSGADLASANCRRTSFKRANLQRACLAGADLSACNLTGADLREADLKMAVLNHTVLNGADLRGADLTGAIISGFLWNAATRFQGVRGVSEPVAATEDDETRPCLSPMVAGAQAPDPDLAEDSLLNDPDPGREATRSFQIVTDTIAASGGRSRSTSRERRYLALTCVSLVLAGVGVAVGLTPIRVQKSAESAGTTLTTSTPLSDEQARLALANAKQQAEAYLTRLQSLEAEHSQLAEENDRILQETAATRGEYQRLTDLVRTAQAETARLRQADDQAALAKSTITALELERDQLAKELQRQTRLGTILAEGARRLETEVSEQRQRVAELAVTADRAELLARELAVARSDAKRESAANEDAQSRVAVLSSELAAVRDDVERYLGRVTGTAWQDLLTDEGQRSPFIPVVAGQTVALGGDYALTVRVDNATRPDHVTTAVTVQRPTGAANPDVALLLYDRNHRILRRLAFGFPSVDERMPVASATAEIACEQLPAYIRVLVAPSLATAAR